MDSTRQLKVSRSIQRELSTIFIKEGSSMYGRAMVSVTIVRLSPDLSVAKIYLSIFGGADHKQVIESLNQHKSKIRFLLGQATKGQMRVVPELIFYHDDSVDYFEKIDNLLKKPGDNDPGKEK